MRRLTPYTSIVSQIYKLVKVWGLLLVFILLVSGVGAMGHLDKFNKIGERRVMSITIGQGRLRLKAEVTIVKKR